MLSVRAQQYHPLLNSGSVWNEENSSYDPLLGPGYATGFKYILSEDTLIEGLEYTLLKHQVTYNYSFIFNDFSFGSNDTSSTTEFVGALREDSAKKVWFFNFNYDSVSLLYDFGVETGDTLKWTYFQTTIASIDSVQLLNGDWRKRFNLNSAWSNENWVEGIGSTLGLFGPYDIPFEWTPSLVCYRSNGSLLYENVTSSVATFLSCDEINGVTEANNLDLHFQILPNPATDFLSVNFSSPNFSTAEIRIVDLLGRNLFSDEIKSGEAKKISTEKFSGSIFFCQLWRNNHLLAVKKIVIQK